MCVSPSNILSIYAKQIQELTLGLLLQTNVKGELVVAGAAGEASQVPEEQHRDKILGKSWFSYMSLLLWRRRMALP